MPRKHPPETHREGIEQARSATRVAHLVAALGLSETTIYNRLKQEKIDRGELKG